MACKDLLSKLSDYIDHDIDPVICEKIDKHIDDCPPCKAFINTFCKTVELLHKRKKSLIRPKRSR